MNDNAQPAARARKPWPAVLSIAVSSFSLVGAREFLPVGLLLNAMAADLGISVGTAGLLVAASGSLAAISAPARTILAGSDRRQVLPRAQPSADPVEPAVHDGHGLPAMLAARVLLGIAVGGFWSLGASTANRLAPAGSEARATSVVYAGISVGIVLGAAGHADRPGTGLAQCSLRPPASSRRWPMRSSMSARPP